MAPKKRSMKSAASAEELERDHIIHRILEDASQLQRQAGVVTSFEVKSLREAFEASVPINMRSSHQLAIQCDNLLHSLAKSCSPGSPDAEDSDREMPTRPPAADKAAADARVRAGWADEGHSRVNWKFTDIPLERRLQTLAVTVLCFFTGLPFMLTMTGLFLYFETTRWFMAAYIIYMFVAPDRHPLPAWRWWIDCSLFKYARDYFPIRLVIPKAVRKCFDPKKNYLLCYHPHGVHSYGALGSFGSNANGLYDMLPGMEFHLQTLSVQFYVPFWREMVRWCGMGDASAKTLENTLTSGPGQCAVLVVGGAEESLMAAPHTNDLLITKRKGFVKLALRTGAALVPVFGFGETDIYGIYQAPPWLKAILLRLQKSLSFGIPLIRGRGWFNYNWGPLPHRKLIVTVVGEPIDLPQISKPSQSDIDHWHAIYVQRLMDLYREHKTVYDLHARTEAHIVK